MTNPTSLSPAAQAVHDAFWSHPNGQPLSQDCPDTDQLAAALRAAADQVVPEEPLYGGDQRWQYERDARQESRTKLLAIAAELEANL